MLFLLISNLLVLFIFGQQLYLKFYLSYRGVESFRNVSGLLIGVSPFVLSFAYLLWASLQSFSQKKNELEKEKLLDQDALTNSGPEEGDF